MEAIEFFTLAGAAAQLVVGLLVFNAEGDGRVRKSLGLLFLFNGIAQLALRSGPGGSLWWAIGIAFDSPTGMMLFDLGIVLALGSRSRVAKWTPWGIGAAAIGFPFAIWQLGPGDPVVGRLADLTVMLGFLSVFAGTVRYAHRREATPYSKALFFAFAPRVIEFFVIIPLTLLDPYNPSYLVQLSWRIPVFVGIALVSAFLVARVPGLRAPFLVAGTLGAIAAFSARSDPSLAVPLYAYFTLILVRPVFVTVALLISQSNEVVFIARKDVAIRAALGIGGFTMGLLFANAIQGSPPNLGLQTMLATSGALMATSIGGLLLDRSVGELPPVSKLPVGTEGFTQGERILLSLRDVSIHRNLPAPYACCSTAISETTGIPAKHIPLLVRRLNSRGPKRAGVNATGPLVAIDEGDVVGIRRKVPRYRLTPLGQEEAEALMSKLLPQSPHSMSTTLIE